MEDFAYTEDEQLAEDLEIVSEELLVLAKREGLEYIPNAHDGRIVDRDMAGLISEFGKMKNGFIPNKVLENVFNKPHCVLVTGLKYPYWVFYFPFHERKTKKTWMDHNKIVPLHSKYGIYYLASLKPNRVFFIKSHCLVRLRQRVNVSERMAMEIVCGVAYDLKIPLKEGDQEFLLPMGGSLKAKTAVGPERTLTMVYTYF